MDLLVLAEVRWGYFRTRKQFLLSRFPPHWRVFYAQPPSFGADDPWRPRREGNVTTFTVPFIKPGTTSAPYNRAIDRRWVRGAIDRIATQVLRWRWRQLGIDRQPAILVSNIYCAGMLPRLRRKLLFYDFNDSPFQFEAVPAWAKDYWIHTRDQIDAFFVVSEHYRRQLAAQTGRPLTLIGNGVELEHFGTRHPLPAELADCPRPLVGYVGLFSHFLDFNVLEAVREQLRGGTLVMIGPGTPATENAMRALGTRAAVRVLGPKPYAALPAYMQALDVGLIPFRANDPFVQGINPNKVYQYLASGVPVVTTPVQDLAPSPPHLMFASGRGEVTRAVEQVLAAPRDPDAVRALAQPYDWSVLAARMVSDMEQRLAMAG